jgi:hypothetical protein
MLNDDTAVEHSALPRPVELQPAETEKVAGGSPTLPLPPPRQAAPWPPPW